MSANRIQKVVIAGGGTAGWMVAAAFGKLLSKSLDIVLVESEEIGTIGVGEATIPPIRNFHQLLGIDERSFVKSTQATFKLGIEFNHWKNTNSRYIHSFGRTGQECWAGEFHHFWLKGQEAGITFPFGDYCFELKAAQANKFAITQNPHINYAYHLDATAYAAFLRGFAETQGVRRQQGKITQVTKDPQSGFIQSLTLATGDVIAGDFFIDCTGFRGLLIEQALHTGYDDWSHWLPCDTACAVQTSSTEDAIPYTRATAHEAGWQWRIPLQHRVGNGLVYCQRYMSDEDAKRRLLKNITGDRLTEPRVIKFTPGKRRQGWNKNCVALGLASGFIEPLESTSIHLIMTGILRLMRMFPFDGIKQSITNEYNTKFDSEMVSIRDFIMLHYKVTDRFDSEFWRHCQSMEPTQSLAHKIDLFKHMGRVYLDDGDIFRVDSWVQVMLGQGAIPDQYHRIADEMDTAELSRFLYSIRQTVDKLVAKLPEHQVFVSDYCR